MDDKLVYKVHRQCYNGDTLTSLSNVINCIQRGHPVMIIMRGLPGCGKTTLAKNRSSLATTSGVFSTNDLFVVDGVYQFDREKLLMNHADNLELATNALKEKVQLIIVDNCNIVPWNFTIYVEEALAHSYEVYMVLPDTEWKWDARECTSRSIHNVPAFRVRQMLDHYKHVDFADWILTMGFKLQIRSSLQETPEPQQQVTVESEQKTIGSEELPMASIETAVKLENVEETPRESTTVESSGRGELALGTDNPLHDPSTVVPGVKAEIVEETSGEARANTAREQTTVYGNPETTVRAELPVRDQHTPEPTAESTVAQEIIEFNFGEVKMAFW